MIWVMFLIQLGAMLLYRASLRRAGKASISFREAAIIAPAIIPLLFLIPIVIGLWDYSTVYGWRRAFVFLWWGQVGAVMAWLLGHILIRWTLRQISAERRP